MTYFKSSGVTEIHDADVLFRLVVAFSRTASSYFAPGRGEKYCDERVVCLSVCPLAYLKNHSPNFTKFSVHVASRVARLWRQCNMLCTSGFVVTSCWSTMGHVVRGQGVYSKWLTRGQHRGRSVMSTIALFSLSSPGRQRRGSWKSSTTVHWTTWAPVVTPVGRGQPGTWGEAIPGDMALGRRVLPGELQ